MFRALKPRGGKKRSILDKQRVKSSERSAKNDTFFSWSLAAKGLVGVLILTLLWGLSIRILDKTHEVTSYLNSVIVLAPREWRIEVTSKSGTPLPDDISREVYRLASRLLRTGNPTELSVLARQVESLGMLDAVKVIRPLADTIILSAELRRPALLASVGGKTRFLTLDGTVYGDANDASGNQTGAHPSVLVGGILNQSPGASIDSSQRVVTSNEEKRHLLEAVDIWQRAIEAGVDVSSINFQKFRGFSILLADQTEIVIGIKPFDYKLKKLRGILDGLKRDGVVASRIELDYEGKAFIKEKKL
ncbi:MAG: hypothetical protein WCO71_07780 [Pseudomonadota bacterium]